MAALFRIIDPDIESSGKHIDKCRQIDLYAIDAAMDGFGYHESKFIERVQKVFNSEYVPCSTRSRIEKIALLSKYALFYIEKSSK